MFFDPKDWIMNSDMDMMFNVRTFKTIRKRIWHDNSKSDGSADFFYFSFHELNASQAVAFLFSSQDDAEAAHPQSAYNKYSFDMVDYAMWNELNLNFQHGIQENPGGFDEEAAY